MPEVNNARKMPGGRLDNKAFVAKVNDALTARFGPGKWVTAGSVSAAYLDLDLIAKMRLDPAEVERVAAAAAVTRRGAHRARLYAPRSGKRTRSTGCHWPGDEPAVLRAPLRRLIRSARTLLHVRRVRHHPRDPVRLRQPRSLAGIRPRNQAGRILTHGSNQRCRSDAGDHPGHRDAQWVGRPRPGRGPQIHAEIVQ